MLTTWRVAWLLLLLFTSALVYAADKNFPAGPPNLKEAEKKGLHRLSVDELKPFLPGVIELKRHRGGLATKTFKPNGKVDVVGPGTNRSSGTWRFDEKRGVYCDNIFRKKDPGERCSATFSAGDGIHYFDYDIDDGLQTIVWRRAADK